MQIAFRNYSGLFLVEELEYILINHFFEYLARHHRIYIHKSYESIISVYGKWHKKE